MQDARYFRDQAMLCLEIARQVSNRQLAEKLQMEAAQYIDRATAFEKEPARPLRCRDAKARKSINGQGKAMPFRERGLTFGYRTMTGASGYAPGNATSGAGVKGGADIDAGAKINKR